MKDNKQDNIKTELERIRKKGGGVLYPAAVVEAAADESNILHGEFEWDDARAGHAYRLWQARQLIAVCVKVLPVVAEVVRCFVSLQQDRADGGGYRTVEDVMSDSELAAAMLADALSDFKSMKLKYYRLKELATVWEEIEKIERTAQKATKRKGR